MTESHETHNTGDHSNPVSTTEHTHKCECVCPKESDICYYNDYYDYLNSLRVPPAVLRPPAGGGAFMPRPGPGRPRPGGGAFMPGPGGGMPGFPNPGMGFPGGIIPFSLEAAQAQLDGENKKGGSKHKVTKTKDYCNASNALNYILAVPTSCDENFYTNALFINRATKTN